MFERFTEQARQVIVLAHVEARLLGHDHIATEHLLLGLATEQDGLAVRILADLGVTAAAIRDEIVAGVGTKEQVPAVSVPFDEGAVRAVEHAVREADDFGQRSVGSEHLLLGVVRTTDAVGARVLALFGLDEERIRAEVVSRVTGPGARLEAVIAGRAAEGEPDAGAPPPAAARAQAADLPDVERLSDADLDLLIDRLTAEKERVAVRRSHVRRARLAAGAERSSRRSGGERDV